MKHRFSFVSLLILLFAAVTWRASAVELPPAHAIKTDSLVVTVPTTNWQMLEDATGNYTLAEVMGAQISSRFHADNTQENGFDRRINTYWLRYRLRNDMAYPTRIAIPEGGARADVYFLLDGKWTHQVTGDNVPWSQRGGLKRAISVVFTIPPGKEVTIYERNQFNYSWNSPTRMWIKINFADKLVEDIYINGDPEFFDTIQASFFFGLLVLGALFNFFFYRIVKEKVYLFYALTLFLGGLLTFSDQLYHLFFREAPWVINYSRNFLFIFQYFFFIHTIRNFIRVDRRYPRWDTFLVTLSALVLILNFCYFFFDPLLPPSWSGLFLRLFNYVSFIMVLSMVGTLFRFLKGSDRSTRLSIIAALPVMVWVLFTFMTIFKLSASASIGIIQWNNAVTSVCLAWLLVILSWTLILRFQKLRQENADQALQQERLAREQETERNALIARQKVELEVEVQQRTAELKHSLENLKTTQAQLIQSEKMASLGELTAGIAHEIQNPLNFVNNFSEVSIELIDELETELQNGDPDEVMALAGDIKQNLEKISHHGKRADSIVKGMLQHSRTGSTTREPADINLLIDECLRLSFHGLRAKDKSFNATLKTDFDDHAGIVRVLKQDLGRVFLNLFTNAFYSVTEKKKTAGPDYEPVVEVATLRKDGQVTITVRDNGTGIPQKILDKIYQPFFTTKPTGEGTGLGLSLSYDIITKGHGGTIDVHTEEGMFAEFTISLPAD